MARLGRFADGCATLLAGDAFRLDMDHELLGDERRAPLFCQQVYDTVRPGAQILIDRGRVRLRVISVGPEHAETRVLIGGTVAERHTVHLLRLRSQRRLRPLRLWRLLRQLRMLRQQQRQRQVTA